MRAEREYYPGEWDVSLDNIKRLVAGNGSLRAAFWGFWVVGTFLLNILVVILLAIYVNRQNSPEIFAWYLQYSNVVLSPYLVFSFVVVWKNTICLKRYWIHVARFVTSLVILETVFDIFRLL